MKASGSVQGIANDFTTPPSQHEFTKRIVTIKAKQSFCILMAEEGSPKPLLTLPVKDNLKATSYTCQARPPLGLVWPSGHICIKGSCGGSHFQFSNPNLPNSTFLLQFKKHTVIFFSFQTFFYTIFVI